MSKSNIISSGKEKGKCLRALIEIIELSLSRLLSAVARFALIHNTFSEGWWICILFSCNAAVFGKEFAIAFYRDKPYNIYFLFGHPSAIYQPWIAEIFPFQSIAAQLATRFDGISSIDVLMEDRASLGSFLGRRGKERVTPCILQQFKVSDSFVL